MHLSLVIPVYNEEAVIERCLAAIARQTVKPHQVIVVDNNSTDDTVAIAARFPFVTIIHEPRQGAVHARNTGFAAAKGEIIGRIDADTVLEPDWVKAAITALRDSETDMVTGKVTYLGTGLKGLVDAGDLIIRRWLARRLGREVAAQGANMAFRRQAWLTVRSDVCSVPGIHEDFDMSIHFNRHGYRVRFDERLEAAIGFRRVETSYIEFIRYCLISPRTYAYHNLRSRIYMYPVVLLVIALYGPLRILHRCYDEATGRTTLRKLFSESHLRPRVNPATHVDYSSLEV